MQKINLTVISYTLYQYLLNKNKKFNYSLILLMNKPLQYLNIIQMYFNELLQLDYILL